MNSEYFLIFFLTVSVSQNSTESSFKYKVIFVPLPKVSPLGSFDTVKEEPAVDTQTCWLSSAFFEVTTTLLDTK